MTAAAAKRQAVDPRAALREAIIARNAAAATLREAEAAHAAARELMWQHQRELRRLEALADPAPDHMAPWQERPVVAATISRDARDNIERVRSELRDASDALEGAKRRVTEAQGPAGRASMAVSLAAQAVIRDAPETQKLIGSYIAAMAVASRLRAALATINVHLAPRDSRRWQTAGWGDADQGIADQWRAVCAGLECDAESALPSLE